MQQQFTQRISILILPIIFLYLDGCDGKRNIFKLPDDIQVEGYWEATGFMDAGTVFEVYKLNQGYFGTKKRIGYAVDWTEDMITAKPDSVKISGNNLIVFHVFGPDTLLIQGDKYYHY